LQPSTLPPFHTWQTAAARHYAWVKQARASGDKRLQLQLFLDDPSSSRVAAAFTLCVSAAIIVQVVTMMLRSGSFNVVRTDSLISALNNVDMALTILFTIELLLFALSRRKLSELLSAWLWWIDLAAVLPFYIDLIYLGITGGRIAPEVIGLLRTLRILRLIKVTKHNPDTQILWRVLTLSSRALLVPLSMLVVGAIFLGTVVYYVELLELGDTEADTKSTSHDGSFEDVGSAVWFMIVTLHTPASVEPATLRSQRHPSPARLTARASLAAPRSVTATWSRRRTWGRCSPWLASSWA
jgi:hypothetical protein